MLKHVIVGIVSLLWVASVGAETLTVCLDGSCDYTDIQSAVDASEDGCVISVAAGTYYESQGSGLLPTINTYEKNVVIQGSVDSTGYPTTIVRHSDAYGVCIVSNGASGDGVLFRDLLVVRSSLRGAVSLSNSTASFENCVLGRSVVFASSGETQLIRAENSQVTCDDCLLTANHAEWGAAISVHGGSLACTATVFQFNQMNILSALEYGGALTAVDAEVSLSDCQFIGNESQVSGAAVALKNCSTVVAGCTFEANKVISSVSPDGGAVYHSQGELQLIDTTFTGNEALNTSCGGAVCSRSGVLLIERCLFESNSADQQGGAVSAGSNSVFRVSQSRFFSNQSFEGGAIHAANPAGLELVDSIVSGNDALNGGGLYLYGVNSSLQSNLICGNTSANISGLFEDAGGNQIFDECSQVTFTVCAEGCHYQDVSEAVGAAPPGSTIQLFAETYNLSETINPSGKSITILGTVDSLDGTPTSILDAQGQFRVLLCNSGEGAGTVFENLVIQNGLGGLDSTPITGLEVGGGGLFVGSSPLLTNCHFKSNTSGRGGGLFLYEASAPTLTGCLFEGNSASLYGGGLYCLEGSNLIAIGTTFENNVANYGGGVFCALSMPEFISCIFVANSAIEGFGGGLYSNFSSPSLSGCEMLGNTAVYGGGLFVDVGSAPTLADCEFSLNSALDCGGGVYNDASSTSLFQDCTFMSNAAGSLGGGMRNNNCNTSMQGCLFEMNTSGFGGGVCSSGHESKTEFLSCTFMDNMATLSGGSCLDSAGVEYTSCYFLRNTAGYGGAIQSENCSIKISDCYFIENNAQHLGGALRAITTDSSVENCSFQRNESLDGGSVALTVNSCDSFIDCEFLENLSHRDGGALYVFDSDAILNGCILMVNSASRDGGAAYFRGSQKSLFGNCDISTNSAGLSGGGVYSGYDGNFELNDCTIHANSSTYSGGIRSSLPGPAVLNSSSVCGNFPDQIGSPWIDDGGNCISELCGDTDSDGLENGCDDCPEWPYACPQDGDTINIRIDDSIQSAINSIPSDAAVILQLEPGVYMPPGVIDPLGKSIRLRGAVDTEGAPTTHISAGGMRRVLQCVSGESFDTVFENLVIRDGVGQLEEDVLNFKIGGGLYVSNDGTPQFINCAFVDNSSDVGGGVAAYFANPHFSSCSFVGNQAVSGGGVFTWGTNVSRFIECRFENNHADSLGGGVYSLGYYSFASFLRSSFIGNSAQYGGGICLRDWNDHTSELRFQLQECAFEVNSAEMYGGAIYHEGGGDILRITACQVIDNIAGVSGGGVRFDSDFLTPIFGTRACGNNPNQISGYWVDQGENEICEFCPGDINLDQVVDGMDLSLMLNGWYSGEAQADLNNDGFVNGMDLSLLLSNWGLCLAS